MKKLWIVLLSGVYHLWFGGLFLVFHLVGILARFLGGRKGLQKSVEYFCLFIIKGLLLLNNRVRFSNPHRLPDGRPLIIVSNHQSMYDIPPIMWYLRRHHPLFVAKKELEKGVPFVSYVLRHSGAACIDRGNSRQALRAIRDMAALARKENLSMVIFPEGTRSKDGGVRTFAWKGLAALLQYCPEALVVPVAIRNTWKLHQHKGFAVTTGQVLSWEVLAPVEPAGRSAEELSAELQTLIGKAVQSES